MADRTATTRESEPIDTVVVLIDGLRASALGAYGQTAYQTPAFDRIAAEGVVASECYARTPDSTVTANQIAERLSAAANEYDTVVVSDDPTCSQAWSTLSDGFVDVASEWPTDIAESIAETDQARVWGAFAEEIAPRLADGDRAKPLLAVCHTRGLYAPWDAPAALLEDLADEEDPAPEACVDPPNTSFDPPHSTEACDARFTAACRYAAMVHVIDACLAGWLDAIESLGGERPVRIVVAGLRGLPLGEHGRVGGVDERLFAEQHHTPLLWLEPRGGERFARRGGLVLADEAIAAVATASGWPQRETIALGSASGHRGLLAAERALLAPPSAADAEGVSLFVRPDDRWQQNDVASLEPETCEAMLAELAGREAAGDSGVAGLGASK